MITVENLSKYYGEKKAVDDLSFTANDGEVLGFLGHNGAGKSTTMNMLTGYISCTSGRAKIDGFDVLEDPLRAKKSIGYLPEHPPLYLEMTVDEYLKFVYSIKRSRLKREAHIAELCEITSISHLRGRVIRNLSKGNRQRVGLAGALIGNPKTLILDEPTVGLDPQQIIKIRELIKKLGAYHSVIFSSHILSEVQATCDRVIIINNGKLIADSKPDELAKNFAKLSEIRLVIDKGEKSFSEIEKIIKTINKVKNISLFGKNTEETELSLDIFSEEGFDIRRELFRALADANLPILQLKANEPTLEEIFIKITEPLASEKKSLRDEKQDRAETSEKGFDLAEYAKKLNITVDVPTDEMEDEE